MAEYNVVALGPPGAGKTVYLAALRHSINSGDLPTGIKMDLDHARELELARSTGALPARPVPGRAPPAASSPCASSTCSSP